MYNSDFSKLMSSLAKLTDKQIKQLQAGLEKLINCQPAIKIIEQIRGNINSCPHCQSKAIVRYGKKDNIQRYLCKSCHKTFNTLTGTKLAHLQHKDAWYIFANNIIAGHSVRKSATNCGIHRNTAFRWRHRFLDLPAKIQPNQLSGIVEADETYILGSMKGQKNLPRKPRKRGGKATKRGISKEQDCILIARDRSGRTLSKLMQSFDCESLKKLLKTRLSSDSILCSDGLKVYKAFAQSINVPHQPLNTKAGIRVIDKVMHIQNVNAYDSRLHQWIARFHGVATKYLDNYLGWFRMIDSFGKNINPKTVISASLTGAYQHELVT